MLSNKIDVWAGIHKRCQRSVKTWLKYKPFLCFSLIYLFCFTNSIAEISVASLLTLGLTCSATAMPSASQDKFLMTTKMC